MAREHHELPYSPEAVAFVSYYEEAFNRACGLGLHADLLGLHRPGCPVTYPGPEGRERTRPIEEAVQDIPKGATVSFVSPRGTKTRIVAGFHGHGWPGGEVVGHAIFELEGGQVVRLTLLPFDRS